MPAIDHSGGRGSPRRRGFRFRSLPLWLQWFLPFAVAGGLVLALVLFVRYETDDVPQTALVSNPKAVAEQNREADILVRQQQAPHQGKLAAGQPAVAALRKSIVGWMTHQINIGALDGPIKRVSCSSAAGGTSGRLVFHCEITASAQMVTYPFDGVVQTGARAITWCQRVTPPIPSMNVPVSKRCT